MASGAIGRTVVMGFDKQGTWGGTPTTLGAGDGFYPISRGLPRNVDNLPDESAGMAWLTTIEQGNEHVSGGPPQYLRFDNGPCIMFMALAMGAYTFQGEQTVSQGDYLHELRLATTNNGYFGTLAWKNVVAGSDDVWEVPSYKPMGFTLEGSAGDLLTLTPIGIGNKMVRTSPTNDMSSVTVTGATSRIQLTKLAVVGGAQGGASYPTTLYPNSFSFTFDRKAGPEHVAHGGTSSVEPEGDGQPQIKLTLGFPQYSSETFVDDWFAATQRAIKITFTGSQIGTGLYETFELEMKDVYVDDDDPAFDGPARTPETVNLSCMDPSGASLPFSIDVVTDTISTALWT